MLRHCCCVRAGCREVVACVLHAVLVSVWRRGERGGEGGVFFVVPMMLLFVVTVLWRVRRSLPATSSSSSYRLMYDIYSALAADSMHSLLLLT
jgi:hypothetical protein